jgi:protein phosphatase
VALITRGVARTDIGLARRRNEDAVEVDGERGIAVVADGMGGHPAGDVASAVAASEVARRLGALYDGASDDEGSLGSLGVRMAEALRGAEDEVRRASLEDPNREGMGTTLTALMVDLRSGRAVLGHVGDSRGYRVRQGTLERLTHDHTWVQEQVDAGRLTAVQARRHPYASTLTQAVGVDPPTHPDIVELEAAPGDVFLLCSDGLTGMLPDERIEALVRRHAGNLEELAISLVDAANLEGGADNITVAILAVQEDG